MASNRKPAAKPAREQAGRVRPRKPAPVPKVTKPAPKTPVKRPLPAPKTAPGPPPKRARAVAAAPAKPSKPKEAPAPPAAVAVEERPKPRKPRKPELAPREIAKIKQALQEQRVDFLREYTEIEEGAFNLSQSEMSGEAAFDEEFADAGSFTFEREKELSIGNNIRDLLDKVDSALRAIEARTYGICESCGEPIAKARLLALPYSTLCIRCKQREERTR